MTFVRLVDAVNRRASQDVKNHRSTRLIRGRLCLYLPSLATNLAISQSMMSLCVLQERSRHELTS